MAVLEILKEPDYRLRKKSSEVEKIDFVVQKLLDDMLETMYEDKGVGLAAPQVNAQKRVIVIDASCIEDDDHSNVTYPLFMINPKILWFSNEKIELDEGCLSVPGNVLNIVRPKGVKVEYLDRNGIQSSIEHHGWLARIIQHENDHLDGKLIVDYLSPLKKDIIVKKLAKMKNFDK